MAIDPTLSLDTPASSGKGLDSSGGLGVPLDTISKLAGVQNQLNQNSIFQQSFAARQRAGQIMASAPDTDSGLAALSKDPQVVGFAPEIAATMQGIQSTLTGVQGQRQVQATSGLQAVLQSLGPSLADPSKFEETLNRNLATLSPTARAAIAEPIATLRNVWGAEAKSNPEAFRQHVAAAMLGAGATGDGIRGILGAPAERSVGNEIQSGLVIPPQGAQGAPGGSFLKGNSQSMGQAPQYIPTPSGAMIPAPALPGGAPAGGNALGLPAGRTEGQGGNAIAGPPTNSQPAGDGKPLFSPDTQMQSPNLGKGVGGLPIMTKTQQDTSSALAHDFATTGVKEFQNAQSTMASLRYMDNAFDSMAKAGGIMTPGSLAPLRTNFAKLVNTVSDMTGKKPPFDPAAIASVEDLNKETNKMGGFLASSMGGEGHTAAQTIHTMIQAVPGIENTYMGGKTVSAGIQAMMQRIIDQRNFQNTWQAKNGGDLNGSLEAFNAQHPAEDYAKAALNKLGLTESGFQGPEQIGAAVQKGYLTAKQAAGLLHQQFPDKFKAPAGGP